MSETKTTQNGSVLTIERTISAPRSRVWAAWTSKDLFEKWWGPLGWQTTVKEMDFIVGGCLHYGMKCEDEAQGEWYGKTSWGKFIYESIDAENEFSYTDYFCDEHAVVDPGMPATKSVMKFEEIDGGTRMLSICDMGSEKALKQLVDMGMIQGLSQTWDRLETLCEQGV
jgi:uncharacterized protein YndB with AHSA1/START domain